MILLLLSILLIVLSGCGGSTDAESQSVQETIKEALFPSPKIPSTGFYKSANDQGLFDKIPNGSDDDIVYLLQKKDEESYVNISIVLPSLSSSSAKAGSSSSDEESEDNPISGDVYCFSRKIDMGKKGEEISCDLAGQVEINYDKSDIKKGFVTKENIKIVEGDVGEPAFYGLYTYNKNSEHKPTLLAELHVYTYYNDDFRIKVFNVGGNYYLNNTIGKTGKTFQQVSEEFFAKAGINIIYEPETYDLRNMQSDGFSKADNYGIEGYLAVRGSQRRDCYDKKIIDDVEMIIRDIQEKKYDNRIAIGLGLETRNYWTFYEPNPFPGDYDFEVCKDVGDDGFKVNTPYKITTVYSTPSRCATGFTNKSLYAKKIGENWYFLEFDGFGQVDLVNGPWTAGRLRDYVDPECDVLMELKGDLNNQNFKFHFEGNGLGITKPIISNSKVSGYLSLNAYYSNGGSGRTNLHEIGHMLGLLDLNDPYAKIEGDLMHYNNESNNDLLRGRGLPVYKQDVGQNSIEYQWDCLHRISESSCADNSHHEFEGGGYLKGSNYSFE